MEKRDDSHFLVFAFSGSLTIRLLDGHCLQYFELSTDFGKVQLAQPVGFTVFLRLAALLSAVNCFGQTTELLICFQVARAM